MAEKEVKIDPTIYAISSAHVGGDKERLQLMIRSGGQARKFEASPEHMKRIGHLLSLLIEEYEDEFEEIETELPSAGEKSDEEKEGLGFRPEQ